MKVYRCDKYDRNMGATVSWHSSRADADSELRRHQRERDGAAGGPEGVTKVEIPITKAGLIAWLNRNFDTDNG